MKIFPPEDNQGKLYATYNNTFVIYCMSKLISPKYLKWTDQNKQVVDSNTTKRVHTLLLDDSLMLYFDKFLNSDLGTYTCIGKHMMHSMKVKVSVYSKGILLSNFSAY